MTCWALTPVRKLTMIFAAGLFLFAAVSMSAQTFNVIYNFTGGTDGGDPVGGLAIDPAGNLYGSAFTGGAGYGTTYELSPSGSGWTFNTLYSFLGFPANDGAGPTGVYVASDGALIGETQAGGKRCRGLPQYDGCGTVYELTPAPRTERVLYRFTGGLDGIAPYGLQPVALHNGDLYSTAFQGGAYGSCIYGYACGASFKLTPNSGTGPWTETVTWDFGSGSDGAEPASGVIFDTAGNMYGTALAGGTSSGCITQGYSGCGVVYELSPSGSGWTETIIYDFRGGADGGAPYSGLVIDRAGNLFGATAYAGSGSGGTIYELSPATGGGWTFHLLYSFAGSGAGPNGQCISCPGSYAPLITDGSGNLYGTTFNDGAFGLGMAFELEKSSGVWTFHDLHDFTGGADGSNVWAGLVRDSSGNLYGAATDGGANGFGVLYEITP
jgi:uncharacterized repeat protein (TIGR03803 family)